VLVRVAEATEVWDDDIDCRRQTRDDIAIVGAIAGPPVQQHHGRTITGALICEPESIDGKRPFHTGEYLARAIDHIESPRCRPG
jgi:hypothetical protein